ncbi:MAG: toll/interleukin-1 receptor domain-containing protein [Bacteroidales bacterium]|nr:toll/interleukin-1 receptor domain-containing protein [Bacteroidales bacterium]
MQNVFISYSRQDFNVVDKVTEALSGNGINYWIDREGLEPGVTFPDKIANSIKDCDVFLFLSSENANASPWTLREISMAIDLGKTVLPVKLDHSAYAPSVALYLSPLQYVDWPALGPEAALQKIVSRINGYGGEPSSRLFKKEELPVFTKAVLYAGLVFLTGTYASLTYMFLWAKTLRSSEIMGGLSGYVCEFGILLSVYYIIRILRLRRCYFSIPVLAPFIMFLAGMLLRDPSVMVSAGLLLLGWLFIFVSCMAGKSVGKSFFSLMSKDPVTLKITDPENLIFVYLIIKAIIVVFSHYLNLNLF